MKELSIIQDDLCQVFGVKTRGAVGHYLTGRRQITPEQLQALADALQCSIEWLVIGKDEGLSKEAAEFARDWEGLPPRERAAMRAAVRALKKPDTDPVEAG